MRGDLDLDEGSLKSFRLELPLDAPLVASNAPAPAP
jgi:hypothetical protein